jgi:hypothetical protein
MDERKRTNNPMDERKRTNNPMDERRIHEEEKCVSEEKDQTNLYKI